MPPQEPLQAHELAQERLIIASALKVLATLFRCKPSDPVLAPFFNMLKTTGLLSNWPFGAPEQLEQIQTQLLSNEDAYGLDMHWQRLFIGPEHLEAPPWGSVYLDREQIVFGDSTLLLSQFLSQQGIRVDTGMNEPEDHIGLMFWYMAGLLEQGGEGEEREEQLRVLLASHILPWVPRYLELLHEHAQTPFFEGLAALAELTLNALPQRFDVQPDKHPLFF